MGNNSTERLKVWIDTLSEEQMKSIILETVEELIMGESVCFWDTTRAPYWDTTGNRLDGLPDSTEDDED